MLRSKTFRSLSIAAALCLSVVPVQSAHADVFAAPTSPSCTTDANCSAGSKCYVLTSNGQGAGQSCMTSQQLSDWAGSGGSFTHVATSPNTTTGNPSGGTVQTGNPTAGTPGGGDCASGTSDNCLKNPLKYSSLEGLLGGVLTSLITVGSILLTLALVFVGFKFVAARGNEEAIRSARTALMWTVIGGLILLGAKAIESVISATVSNISA